MPLPAGATRPVRPGDDDIEGDAATEEVEIHLPFPSVSEAQCHGHRLADPYGARGDDDEVERVLALGGRGGGHGVCGNGQDAAEHRGKTRPSGPSLTAGHSHRFRAALRTSS